MKQGSWARGLSLALVAMLFLAACSPAPEGVAQARQQAQQLQQQIQQAEDELLQAIASRLPAPLANLVPGAAIPDTATTQAIKAVIQKGNSEQVQAIARHDSSAMRDTSTDGYYQQISQDNQDALANGVTAIKLVKLQWGAITVRGSTATAITYETWSTTFDDGTSDQSTDRNVYTLVQQNGAWKIQSDDQPDSGSSSQPNPVGSGQPAPSSSAAPSAAPPSAAAISISAPAGSPQAAIEQVILKGNHEQEQAIAQHDSSVMQDSSTASYYQDLAQSNQDMIDSGVTAIKLIDLQWGPVNVNGTTATATTFETWWTEYSDGSTDQTRDRNVYTLVQQNGGWKVQTDDHPDSGLEPAPTSSTAPNPESSGSASPAVPPASIAPTGRNQSSNWAGYAATGGTFTEVAGTWAIPQVSGNGSVGADAAWVGIGGANSRDLIQAGTEETVLSSGRVEYDAWIEMLPQSSHPIPLGVHGGDSVSVSIKQAGDTNSWDIAFTNNTTGSTYSRTVQYTSTRSSAEWIEEAPSGVRGGILPIDNFGSIIFSKASTVKDGKTDDLTQAGAKPITMINGSRQPVAQTSVISSDGSGFSVTRTSNPASTGGGRRRSAPTF